VIGFDITATSRVRELRAEARALRRQTRTLIRRTANHCVVRGISDPMLVEIAYDLTALGLHDFSWLRRAAAGGIARERLQTGTPDRAQLQALSPLNGINAVLVAKRPHPRGMCRLTRAQASGGALPELGDLKTGDGRRVIMGHLAGPARSLWNSS
jgi:hypothetical protein